MKKQWIVFLLAISMISLAGCTDAKKMQENQVSQSASTSLVEEQKATITLQEDGKELLSKTIEFTEGQSVYEVLKNNFDIEDQDGFITKIDGKEQDPTTSKYWMYTINGQEASKGVKDTLLKANDTIVFNLSKV